MAERPGTPEINASQSAADDVGQGSESFRLLVESVKDYAILMLDPTGRIVSWNRGAERIKGYQAEEIIGRHFSCFYPPEDVERGKPERELRRAAEEGRFEEEGWRVRKDGTRFWANVVITALRGDSGELRGFAKVTRDVTRQKLLEEQIRRKNEEVVEQYLKAQGANRLKSEFLANMSHELRTPLNAIIGFAELMHDGKVGAVSADHKEYLGDILTSSRHLLQLINDILDLSKVEAGKVEFRPEPVDLSRIVGEVCDVLRTLAAQKRIQIKVLVDSALTGIVADPAKLKQVLYNYLSNALKFSPDEGRVIVRVGAEGESEFRIEVEDSGIGIRPEDIGRLFVEFQQLDASSAKKHAGTGLGLALTRRIVEAQGGRVGVESTPGSGSVFFAVLPRFAAPKPSVEPATLTPPDAPRVLVIEDDAKDQAWLVRTLAAAGYAVEAASTGSEGIARCREMIFDAITLDLLLPDMTGRDVLKAIRGEDLNRGTPVIVVTVLAGKGIVAGFKVHDILQKPVQNEDLLASLKRAGIGAHDSGSILVIDDDRAALKLAEKTLERLGYRAVCRTNARDGLAAALQERPAAVILDLAMPDLDGFEFLKRFRATPAGRSTPVIVWTVKDLTAQERELLHASVQGIAGKGDGSAALIQELEAHVRAPDIRQPDGRDRHGG